MTLARAILFNLLFYVWTLFVGIVALPMLLAPRRWVSWFGATWSASVMWLAKLTVGLDWEVRGREHLPAGPGLIAMKHQSAWDTIALPVIFTDCAVVLKKELTWLPLYGWYVMRAGSIAVDRKAGASALKGMVKDARRTAAEGRSIAIFPEGTRVAVGAPPAYQPGIAALYRDLGLPVVPVAVNSGLFWGRRAFMKRPGRIVVEILPPIAPGLDRRAFMAELETRIETATERLTKAC